ncbi:MAG: MFS transporter [Burkholderiales bacterium]
MDERALQRITLLVVTMSSFATPLMLAAPNVSVPAIAAAFGTGVVAVGWVSTAYLLSSAVFLLPFGKLADAHGRRRFLLWGLGAVALGSALCAAAPNFPALVAARLFQGIGAGMLYATSMALLSSVYPKEKRGAAIGISTSMIYFGLTAGPLLGGWITHQFGWRMVFVLPLPLLAVCLYLGITQLKGEWKAPPGGRFDLAGALIYAASIIALMGGVSNLPSAFGWLATLGAGAGMVVFFAYEHRHKHPLFDVSLFYTNRVFTFSCLASLLIYAATFANTFLMSLYLQKLKGLDAQTAGLIMISQPIMMALLSPFAGTLSDRIQPRVLASTGMALCAAGLVLLASAQPDTAIAVLIGYLLIVGTGFALFSSPNMSAIMGSVEPRQYGTASSSVATVRVVGQMMSMALITLVSALVMGRLPIDPAHFGLLAKSIQVSFIVAAALCLAGMGLSLARGQLRR